jgi:hypothetical protein
MSETEKESVVHSEVLPPEARGQLTMPAGTPLGLGFLGAMRFEAIRRVLESYERALRSAEAVRDAETAHNAALARRAVSHEQLLNLDVIRKIERDRIQMESTRITGESVRIKEEAEIAGMRRKLEKLEVEGKLVTKQAQLDRLRSGTDANEQEDEFSELITQLRQMPGIADAMLKTKEDIVKKFGGEDKLGEEGQQLIETMNALINATLQKRAEGSML